MSSAREPPLPSSAATAASVSALPSRHADAEAPPQLRQSAGVIAVAVGEAAPRPRLRPSRARGSAVSTAPSAGPASTSTAAPPSRTRIACPWPTSRTVTLASPSDGRQHGEPEAGRRRRERDRRREARALPRQRRQRHGPVQQPDEATEQREPACAGEGRRAQLDSRERQRGHRLDGGDEGRGRVDTGDLDEPRDGLDPAEQRGEGGHEHGRLVERCDDDVRGCLQQRQRPEGRGLHRQHRERGADGDRRRLGKPGSEAARRDA